MTGPWPNRMPDWLVLGQEEWDEVERRNQLLIRAMAERHPGSRFLFAEIPLRPRELRRWRIPAVHQVADNIWVTRAVRPLPGPRLQRGSDRLEVAQLCRSMRAIGLDRPALWTQDPRAATLLDLLGIERIVYDLTDDWAAFESDPVRRSEVQRRIEFVGTRAELVLACSRPLEEDARTWSDHVRYLPNAVDPPGPAAVTPADLAALPRPRLCYVGTQHSSRLDVGLVAQAAALRPRWSFVLVGPNKLDSHDDELLGAVPNVHQLGVRPHADVRSYLEGMDVCLVPHLVTEFTRSLDPLKLYEYLAAGRPVIATPLGNSPDLETHVTTAESAAELVAAAERLVAEDEPGFIAARRAAVADETWEARAIEVEQWLGAASPADNCPEVEVSVVIVSYNTRELLERCLNALELQEGVGFETIVVDNASSDGSADMVRRRFADAHVIELAENAGFGAANNVASPYCRGEYVLLLNSDAFMEPGSLAALLAAARRHPEAGAVGPRLLNEDGTLQRSAWPFPSAGRLLLEAFGLHRPMRTLGLMEDLGTWDHATERSVDFLVGACLLVPRDALEAIGGFDEEFWLYAEEADLQRRLVARGQSALFTPEGEVTHVGGASSKFSAERLRHFYRGQKRFLQKHGGPFAWPLGLVALLVGSALRRRWAILRLARNL
jgi:GT2 family glycosyltransferase/glycosyltransferase involved in cell wall biosynthesis